MATSHSRPAIVSCASPTLPVFFKRLANDDVAFARMLVGGRDEVGPLEIARIDVGGVDELDEVDRLLALELDRVDLLGLERDVGVVVDLVALDDVGVVDLADALHRLGVVDAAAGGLVDLAEGDLGLALDRVVDLNGDRDEGEAQEAFPVGARGHDELRNRGETRLDLKTLTYIK